MARKPRAGERPGISRRVNFIEFGTVKLPLVPRPSATVRETVRETRTLRNEQRKCTTITP